MTRYAQRLAELETTCPDCGQSVQLRPVHGHAGKVMLDVYPRPARDGLTWILRADQTADLGTHCGGGLLNHANSCPAKGD